jgi:hypothetical protein
MAESRDAAEVANDHLSEQDVPLRIVGETPTPFDIITRQGVVEALWAILEEATEREATPSEAEGTK